jgi:hypothetical protein
LLKHREELFKYLRERWQDQFAAKFDVLLYDLTSTYFESDPPFPEGDKRRFGYSRDKRPDCVQVVIALVVTPEGYPLAYEVLPGNTSDKTTLKQFLEKIQTLYGKADRVWVMDRGIPTEEVILEMQQADPQIRYLVGTPKGRLTRLEAELVKLPWQQARPAVRVKLLPQDKELYVFVESQDRLKKERAMRLSKLRALIKRLTSLPTRVCPVTRYSATRWRWKVENWVRAIRSCARYVVTPCREDFLSLEFKIGRTWHVRRSKMSASVTGVILKPRRVTWKPWLRTMPPATCRPKPSHCSGKSIKTATRVCPSAIPT